MALSSITSIFQTFPTIFTTTHPSAFLTAHLSSSSAFPLNIPQVKLLISTSTPNPCSLHTLPHLRSSITSLLVTQAPNICLILDPSLSLTSSTFHLSAKSCWLHCTTFSEFIISPLLPPSSKLPTLLARNLFQ